MAEFTLNGRTKVKTLKANFKENFGSTLRVYKSASCKGGFADDDATLASIRAEGAKGGDLVVKGNMQVGNFEKKVAEMYGIGVQVATKDDSALADNSITLAAARVIELSARAESSFVATCTPIPYISATFFSKLPTCMLPFTTRSPPLAPSARIEASVASSSAKPPLHEALL